ncbi:MAG: hypothetical protein ACR2RB_08440 [Gammaproteobacteria bacterium]
MDSLAHPQQSKLVYPDVSAAAKVAYLESRRAHAGGMVQTTGTHMSWVFLTERYVYKLKKPVRYPHLDFSTIDARHRNCELEVNLNRRLAGDVYIGVVPLTVSTQGELSLDGGGKPVDYLVLMRRLGEDHALEHIIRNRLKCRPDLCRTAALLARFYERSAPIEIGLSEYRGRFEFSIEANRRALLNPIYGLPRNAVRDVSADLLEFVNGQAELLNQRVHQNRLIEAHGDLRPAHIYLRPHPAIIDCLEFKRDLRLLDIADDLAFLALECERRGAESVGSTFLQVYSRITDDRPDQKLLRFYKSCHAYTRARLATAHLDDPAVHDKERWQRQATDYLRLAQEHIRAC